MENENLTPKVEYPMKWHKFLIYFSLWAGMVLNLVNGISTMLGAQYGDEKDFFYGVFPSLRVIDILLGLFLLGFVVLAFITRKALAEYREVGPKYLQMLYIFDIGLTVIYLIAVSASMEVGLGELMIVETFSGIVGNVAMIFINKAYYGKRSALFTK